MTHLPQEVTKIKVRPPQWLRVNRVGDLDVAEPTMKQSSRLKTTIIYRLTGNLMFILSAVSICVPLLRCCSDSLPFSTNIYLNVQSLDDPRLCWTCKNCQASTSPPLMMNFLQGCWFLCVFFFDIEEQNLWCSGKKQNVKPRLRFSS